jgi:AraC-like DNA-binding protein
VSGSLSFDYAEPAQHAEYTQFFGRNVAFDQPFSGIVFARKLLDAPSPQPDDGVLAALQEVAERRMQRISRGTPYAVRVRDLLVQGFREGTEMERTARALDMSARSLRRHLLAEGKSYNTLVNEALGIVATHLLRDERRTIQEVGYELGFSEMSAFYRAFKRWTGVTPGAWREAQRS